MTTGVPTGPRQIQYFQSLDQVQIPSTVKVIASRLAFPFLSLLSREQSLRWGLTPIDDERVVMALRYVRGRVLDVGCGGNLFVRSYGDGVGVDVVHWEGCDQVIKDAAKLPFEDASFDTVSFLACLNHIPNREEALIEARRVLKPDRQGQVLLTMIPPRLGVLIHWLRGSHDADQKCRRIDHSKELLGMSSRQIRDLLSVAGFRLIRRRRFCFGTNSLYVATVR